MEERFYYFWLSAVRLEARVRQSLKGNLAAIMREFERDDQGLTGTGIRERLSALRRQGIGILLPGDERFEQVFGELAAAGIQVPYILYTKGDESLLTGQGVAIVGSRAVSDYGRCVTRGLVQALEGEAVVIVSGGARGVDRVAHETALAVGLPTVCVLGCGIGYNYPREHQALFETISRRGLLLSEYEPMLPPRQYFFPERNRIIAQVSQVVVVTQAAAQSGALITAEHALDCGRTVLSVPWEITREEGAGCNFLLQAGAGIITSREHFKEIVT